MSLVVEDRQLAVPVELKNLSFAPDRGRYALDIDRSTCKREVPMEVLVLGLPRTSTSSIRSALFTLGYFDVYHGVSPWDENPPDALMWNQAFAAKFEDGPPFTKENWDQLLGHCMAVTDHPCSIFAEELIAAYPDAKVILSVRDNAEVWRNSMEKTVVQVAKLEGERSLFQRVKELFVPPHFLDVFGRNLVKYDRLLDVSWDHKRMYDGHEARVRMAVGEEGRGRFLLYNVKEGWGPLCRFLGKEAPGTEFPRNNDRAAFEGNLERLYGRHRKRLLVYSGALVGIVAVVHWMKRR